MPFDQPTRNRLARFVGEARTLLSAEFTRQLQQEYGMDPTSGDVADLARLTHLDDAGRETAAILRQTLRHYLAGNESANAKARRETLERIVREQAFTVLNRLCALRLAEARGLLIESVGRGHQSQGFQMYARLAGGALGETGDAYRVYLFSLFDEFAVDLAVLFDRFSPQGRLFPINSTLLDLLTLINQPELDSLWGEDETIGWIYQYFNTQEERRQMRAESQAPRNSRELAVRNQFFTPRYVVEFLTDNTLGRIWYEMTVGRTQLAEGRTQLAEGRTQLAEGSWQMAVGSADRADTLPTAHRPLPTARYLVRRPHEIFLAVGEVAPVEEHVDDNLSQEELLRRPVYVSHRPLKDPRTILMLDPACGSMHFGLYAFDLYETIYSEAWEMQEEVCRGQLVEGGGERAEGGRERAEGSELTTPLPTAYHPLPTNSRRLDYGSSELSRSDRMAESDGPGRSGLSGDEDLSERGDVRSDQSVAASGSLDSVEHRGRAGAPDQGGFHPLSVDLARLGVRSGDADDDRSTAGFSAPREGERGARSGGGDRSPDSRTYQLFGRPIDEQTYARCIDALNAAGWSYALDDTAYCPLPTVYPDKVSFLRDVPRLIIEHNIHGIDIDPRAVQIAGLSLWLRAQKSWQAQGVKPAERPTITRSNIVCAEPMPGDKAQLDAFLKTLADERLESLIRRVIDVAENQRVRATPTMADALCDLVRSVWDEMRLAGEAGSLLKIEESLAAAIQKARDEWEQRLPLFRVETFRLTEEGQGGAKPQVTYLRSAPGGPADFWERAEALVLAALEQYAGQAEGDGFARRLFAADAARGFAFIDVCRKRYDVALMNPPFGEPPKESLNYLRGEYPEICGDLYSTFVTRMSQLAADRGMIGVLSSRTGFFLGSFETWRREVLNSGRKLSILWDLGQGVLDDAVVEVAAYCMTNTDNEATICIRGQQGGSNNEMSWLPEPFMESELFVLTQVDYDNLPGNRIVYWVPRSIRNIFINCKSFTQAGYSASTGLKTSDDFRFVRSIWEVPPERIRSQWNLFTKGGEFSPFYDDLHLVVNWADNGRQIKALAIYHGNTPSRWVSGERYYFEPGLTYVNVSSIGFSVQPFPKDGVFSIQGQFVAAPEGSLPFALLTSRVAESLLDIINPGRHYQAGQVQLLPVPPDYVGIECEAEQWALQCSEIKRSQTTFLESSRNFSRLYIPPAKCENLKQHVDMFISHLDRLDRIIGVLASRIDLYVEDLYGLDESGVKYVFESTYDSRLRRGVSRVSSISDIFKGETRDDYPEFSRMLISYTVGVTIGRWDIRHIYLDRELPEMPSLFAPVTPCPPGMLQNAAGLPAAPADVPADYPLRISWPGILVDDPGHPEDIVGRVREALAVIWPDTHDAIEQEACQILGVATLRDYFANPNRFFDDHLKRYSKSRRQAPIYWPLSTPSGSYTLWVYYHRLTDQMLYTCVNDFVEPKLKQMSEDVARLRQHGNRSRDDERALERLIDLERELRELRAELLRLAPIWKPNLNDGVQITAAPLWKLFQHRGWQRTLRETWQTLEAGDYDWAHLAMSLWPARVVPKCTTDRSLAIAHDLEELFWVEDGGRWRALMTPEQEIANQRARQQSRLSDDQRGQLLAALRLLASGPARGVAAAQVAQHLADGAWDDTELALLCWPERVAEKCLDDPFLAAALRLNLPPKRSASALKRWIAGLSAAGCPDLAGALLVTLDDAAAFERVVADLEAGRRDAAPLALALWPQRVIDRCLENPELAAAHDLRKYFWVERPGEGWRRRRAPQVEVRDEVARRAGGH